MFHETGPINDTYNILMAQCQSSVNPSNVQQKSCPSQLTVGVILIDSKSISSGSRFLFSCVSSLTQNSLSTISHVLRFIKVICRENRLLGAFLNLILRAENCELIHVRTSKIQYDFPANSLLETQVGLCISLIRQPSSLCRLNISKYLQFYCFTCYDLPCIAMVTVKYKRKPAHNGLTTGLLFYASNVVFIYNVLRPSHQGARPCSGYGILVTVKSYLDRSPMTCRHHRARRQTFPQTNTPGVVLEKTKLFWFQQSS